MKITKKDMARVITTALFNLDKLAPENHHYVTVLMKQKKDTLTESYQKSLNIINNKLKEGIKND